MEIERITAVVPIAQFPETVEKQPDDQFQRSTGQNRIKKYFQGLPPQRKKEKVHEDGACPIDGKPGAVKEAAVSEMSFFQKEEKHFPHKAAERGGKKVEDQQGNVFLGCCMAVFRQSFEIGMW